jgi:outer membrane biosynthesis protein TonB
MLMSVTFTERQAIEKYMQYLMDQSQHISNEMAKCMDRLGKLDEIDNVHPINPPQVVEVKKETPQEDFSEAVSKYIQTLKRITQEEPVVTAIVEAPVEEEEKQIEEPEEKVEEEEKPEEPETGMTVQEAIERLNKQNEYKAPRKPKTDPLAELNKTRKRSRKAPRDIREMSTTAAAILKEVKKPMQLKDLMAELEDRGYSTNSPYALMAQIMNYQYSTIEKAKFGYYQYKG